MTIWGQVGVTSRITARVQVLSRNHRANRSSATVTGIRYSSPHPLRSLSASHLWAKLGDYVDIVAFFCG